MDVSWTMKKAEHWRLDAFELWCWRRLLRVLWTARRSNQSILKEISPEYLFIGRTDAEAENPILRPPDVKNWLIGKDPDAGKDWRQGEKGTTEFEMASLTQWTRVWVNSRTWWLTGRPGVLQAMVLQRVDTTEQLNWLKTQEDMFPKPATFVCRLDVYLG